MTRAAHVHVGGSVLSDSQGRKGKRKGRGAGGGPCSTQSRWLTVLRLTQLMVKLATFFFQTFYFEVRPTEKFYK